MNGAHFVRNKTEEDVDVVNHEIQDNVHIGPSSRKGTRPLRLEQERVPDDLSRRKKRSIETLQLTHLQNKAFSFGQSDQEIRLFQGAGKGFFQENIHALLKKIGGDRIVQAGLEPRC